MDRTSTNEIEQDDDLAREALEAAELELAANEQQDASLAVLDAEILVGALTELAERVVAHDLDAASTADILKVVLPRLDALRAYVLDVAA